MPGPWPLMQVQACSKRKCTLSFTLHLDSRGATRILLRGGGIKMENSCDVILMTYFR